MVDILSGTDLLEEKYLFYQLENMMKNRYKSTGGMQSGDFETDFTDQSNT